MRFWFHGLVLRIFFLVKNSHNGRVCEKATKRSQRSYTNLRNEEGRRRKRKKIHEVNFLGRLWASIWEVGALEWSENWGREEGNLEGVALPGYNLYPL